MENNQNEKNDTERQIKVDALVEEIRTSIRNSENRVMLQEGVSKPILNALDGVKAGLLNKSLDIVSSILCSNEDTGVIYGIQEVHDLLDRFDLSSELSARSFLTLNTKGRIRRKVSRRQEALIASLELMSEKVVVAWENTRTASDILELEKPVEKRAVLGHEHEELMIVSEAYKTCFDIFSGFDKSKMSDFDRSKLEFTLAYLQKVSDAVTSCQDQFGLIEMKHKALCNSFWNVAEGVSLIKSVKLPRFQSSLKKLLEDWEAEEYKVHYSELCARVEKISILSKQLTSPLNELKNAFSFVENHVFENQKKLQPET